MESIALFFSTINCSLTHRLNQVSVPNFLIVKLPFSIIYYHSILTEVILDTLLIFSQGLFKFLKTSTRTHWLHV